MGQFRFTLTAVGGHGCQREVKDGQTVQGCGRIDCPDCVLAAFIPQFIRQTGSNIEAADLVHWPGTSTEVRDEFNLAQAREWPRVSRTRHGNF